MTELELHAGTRAGSEHRLTSARPPRMPLSADLVLPEKDQAAVTGWSPTAWRKAAGNGGR